MKTSKLGYVLVALTISIFAATSVAAADISAFAGMAMPTGDFGDAANSGYYVGGAYAMPVAPKVSVGIHAAYNHFGWAQDVEGDFNAIEALAFGKVAAPTGPFGLLGMGVSNSKAVIETFESDRSTDFAMAIGGGYALTKLQITALYHSLGTEGNSINYFTLSAGMGF
jgi:hypothetical protein